MVLAGIHCKEKIRAAIVCADPRAIQADSRCDCPLDAEPDGVFVLNAID
jgi:hypothetical protein